MEHIVIGIEGLVGAGKTTMARKLLDCIPDSIILHGGNIYRAVVATLLKSGLSGKELAKQASGLDPLEILKQQKLSVEIENRESVIYWNGKKMEEKDLQSEASSMAVSQMSQVANNQKLYAFGRALIRSFKEKYNVILSSRDIMKMYPETDYHFFITASLEERIRRKYIQYTENQTIVDEAKFKQELKEHIQERDELQEKAGYYKQYEKTIVIDVTEDTAPEQSVQKMLAHMKIPSMR